jgi:hypothetical protein
MTRVAVLDPDQPVVGFHPVGAGQQPVGVPDPVRPSARAGERRLGRAAVPREVRVAQPRPAEDREVVRGGDLPRGVVAVGGADVGVTGAQGPRLGLHPGGRRTPAAAEPRQDVHGVVPGVEEHPAPQVGHPVGPSLGDPDETAAGADAREVLRADRVPEAAGQHRQDGQGEQGLERACRRQSAVGVVRREELPAAGVGHHPRQRGHVREPGRAPVRPDLGPGVVQQVGRSGRGLWSAGRGGVGARVRGRRRGGAHQKSRHAQCAGRDGKPGGKSDSHTAKLGTDRPRIALAGPWDGREHPDAAHRPACH